MTDANKSNLIDVDGLDTTALKFVTNYSTIQDNIVTDDDQNTGILKGFLNALNPFGKIVEYDNASQQQYGEFVEGTAEVVELLGGGIGVIKYGGKKLLTKLVDNVDVGDVTKIDIPANADNIPWNSWGNYTKVTKDQREYALVGERFYSRHAVDCMQPSGLGSPAGTIGAGRNISPSIVEDVITNGTKTNTVFNGVTRTIHSSGNVQVVTEEAGKVVVTILRKSS